MDSYAKRLCHVRGESFDCTGPALRVSGLSSVIVRRPGAATRRGPSARVARARRTPLVASPVLGQRHVGEVDDVHVECTSTRSQRLSIDAPSARRRALAIGRNVSDATPPRSRAAMTSRSNRVACSGPIRSTRTCSGSSSGVRPPTPVSASHAARLRSRGARPIQSSAPLSCGHVSAGGGETSATAAAAHEDGDAQEIDPDADEPSDDPLGRSFARRVSDLTTSLRAALSPPPRHPPAMAPGATSETDPATDGVARDPARSSYPRGSRDADHGYARRPLPYSSVSCSPARPASVLS